jgi:hypothetical protein
MLTAVQRHSVDQFAKSLSALGDDALIDTYHQAREDHREASAEASHMQQYRRTRGSESRSAERGISLDFPYLGEPDRRYQ